MLTTTESNTEFELSVYLSHGGFGRRTVELNAKEHFFTQGDPADSVFYLQHGRAKISVVSQTGKEATITLLAPGDFIGEGALSPGPAPRLSTVTALTSCVALKIMRDEMIRVMHEEHGFSDMFMKFLVERGVRAQADLVDQLFNSSEKRLARTLLLMADFDKPGQPATLIPPITQQTLADMIGTTRSRVSFFMNRFRELGFINYNGRIEVHKSLLSAVLHDQLPDPNAEKPPILSVA